MGAPEELDFAELIPGEHAADMEKAGGVNGGLHHHVALAGLLDGFDDVADAVQGGGHGDGAGAVLSGAEGLNGLLLMEGNGGDQVDGVYVRVLEDFLVAVVGLVDAVAVGKFLQHIGIGVVKSDGGDVGMGFINGDKSAAEAKADQHNVQFSIHDSSPFFGWDAFSIKKEGLN